MAIAGAFAISRVLDKRRHFEDVVAGALLGGFFAVYVWLRTAFFLQAYVYSPGVTATAGGGAGAGAAGARAARGGARAEQARV